MLMPDDVAYLRVLEERARDLRARREDAQRRQARARAKRLQAEIAELDADYDKIIEAAVLILDQTPSPFWPGARCSRPRAMRPEWLILSPKYPSISS